MPSATTKVMAAITRIVRQGMGGGSRPASVAILSTATSVLVVCSIPENLRGTEGVLPSREVAGEEALAGLDAEGKDVMTVGMITRVASAEGVLAGGPAAENGSGGSMFRESS